MKLKSCVLLLSGGVDSVNTLHLLLKDKFNVFPLFIDYGQKALKNELTSAQFFSEYFNAKPLKEIRTNIYKTIEGHPLLETIKEITLKEEITSKNYLHFRNLTFACLGAIYAKNINVKNIAFGFISKLNYTLYPDTSPDFISKLNELFKLIEPSVPINILAPLITRSKTEIIQYSIKNEIPIQKTYSCYEKKKCYKCESCLDVINAFNNLSKCDSAMIDIHKFNPYKTRKI